MSDGMDDSAFAAFCAAGLWPGLGRTAAERLPAAGINGPDDVSAEALVKVEGVAAKRADRLVKTFADARPRYDVAELLHGAGLAVRGASAVVDHLGDTAASVLRADPWQLLDSGAVQPRDADVLALRTLAERPEKSDLRRGRAFTAYVLARAARDGHTMLPTSMVSAALAGLDIPDPAAAIAAAGRWRKQKRNILRTCSLMWAV